ncbi:MAG: hypothetical protein JXA30_18680 [Deltaproteobacteria bacterium]|nr:hypothetical protein [Deltaproteobacteria bacterium]
MLLLVAPWLAALFGCGASVERIKPVAPKALSLEAAVPILFVDKPTPGLVQLSLWVDAGSRDAAPPQVATVAAWVAARRAGSDVQAYVLPDGIEFSLLCESREITRCLFRMSRALASRNPGEKEVQQARSKLEKARLAAESKDQGRAADRLAITALFGSGADAFFPLGQIEADEGVTKASVGDFLANHFGPSRALLVAVGKLQVSELSRVVQDNFSINPQARSQRAKRLFDCASAEVRAEIGGVDEVTISAVAPDLASAVALGRSVNLSLLSAGFASPIKPVSHAFQLRGGALVTIRLSKVSDAISLVRYAASEFFRLRIEGVEMRSAVSAADSPKELARTLGSRWCSQEERSNQGRYGLGVGVIASGGRADRLKSDAPDDGYKKRLQASLQQALKAAKAIADPKLQGSIREDRASLAAANGASIKVEKRTGDNIAVAVRFAKGAESEPKAVHGRTALLATLATISCRGFPAELLKTRLREIDACIIPMVDSDSWGVVVTAPKKNWRQAVDIAMACALRPSTRSQDIAYARLRLLEKFRGEATSFRFASQAGLLISPASPGWVAPWGSPDSVANISSRELNRAVRDSVFGEAATIAAVGNLPVGQTARRIARRVAHLPKGLLPKAEAPSDARSFLLADRSPDSDIWAVIAWRSPGPVASRDGALAFVLRMRTQLETKGGIEPVWHDAGAGRWGAWAAIALRITDEALVNLERNVAQATRTMSEKDLSKLIDDVGKKAHIESVVAAAQLRYAAERLARKQMTNSRVKRDRKAALDTARQLLVSTPRFAIARPRAR